MKTIKLILLLCIVIGIFGCVSKNDLNDPIVDELPDGSDNEDPNDPLSALDVAATFNYATSKNITLELDVPTNLKGAVFTAYSKIGAKDSMLIGKGSF